MSDPIWDKFDKHDEIISLIQQRQAASEAHLQAMDARIDRNQTELVRSISRLEVKIDEGNKWMNQSQGGLHFGKWFGGIIAAIGATFLAWLKFFKDGG